MHALQTPGASGRQTLNRLFEKTDNLYEKRTNPLARLFTTFPKRESSNLFFAGGLDFRKLSNHCDLRRYVVESSSRISKAQRPLRTAAEWRGGTRQEADSGAS